MTVQMLEKAMKTAPHPVFSREAQWLYTHFPPLPVARDRDHTVYKKVVEFLMDNDMTGGEFRTYLDAVIHFLDEYERERFSSHTTPEEVLRFLMDQHNLTQMDLAHELGGQPVVSEVLSGKRKLTRDQIERLSRRFSVSPASFF